VSVLLPTLRLREHRERLGLTQSELAERLVQMAWARDRIRVGANSDMVSKWERGLKQPSKLYRRLLCLTLDASPHELGFLVGADDTAAFTRLGASLAPGLMPVSSPHFMPGSVNADVINQLAAAFASLTEMDSAVGPRLVLGAAAHLATALEQLSARPHKRLQREVQLAAARFAELTGWLHQDLGDLEQARRWSERALDLAVLSGNPELITYMLMRRSTVAAERGDANAARSLAEAAVPEGGGIRPSLVAVSLRASALAYSLTGDGTACVRALGEAQDVLAGVEPSHGDLAPYCTPAYLAMEAGKCWLNLGRPQKAISSLESALSAWPDGQGRDRSLAVSRLACAYAEVGDVEQACRHAEQAHELVVVTGSARAVASLTSLGTRLAPHSRQDRVAALRRRIGAL